MLSDNGSAYRSNLWLKVCTDLGVTPKWIRPYRHQTNGKIEGFHRTLADGWGYARCYTSETERKQALPGWLHHYNHHRPHTASHSLRGPPTLHPVNQRPRSVHLVAWR